MSFAYQPFERACWVCERKDFTQFRVPFCFSGSQPNSCTRTFILLRRTSSGRLATRLKVFFLQVRRRVHVLIVSRSCNNIVASYRVLENRNQRRPFVLLQAYSLVRYPYRQNVATFYSMSVILYSIRVPVAMNARRCTRAHWHCTCTQPECTSLL